jgi:hypothetical protein
MDKILKILSAKIIQYRSKLIKPFIKLIPSLSQEQVQKSFQIFAKSTTINEDIILLFWNLASQSQQ